jgi:threonine dehydrogenase-like Zn-dependent dehydrogenase
MRALFYPDWNTLEIADLQVPVPQPGEVLVRVSQCGICGSELETFRSRSPRRNPPLIMGHEFCGTIAEVGSKARKWKAEDKVISHALVHCGRCFFCLKGLTNLCEARQVFGMHRPGAFGQFVAVPEEVLFAWPEGLDADAAVLAEPLANGINALTLDPSQSKERVVVIGAGPIGLMCIAAARALENSEVIAADLQPERLEVASILGASRTFNPKLEQATEVLRRAWGQPSADYVVDAVGSKATKRLSFELARPGGTIVWVGLHDDTLEMDTYPITLQQKRILGSYSGSREHVQQAISILAGGHLPTNWMKKFHLQDGVNGFFQMLEGKKDNVKGILDLS